MTYLSVFRRDALIPGTVSIRPSNEAEIWNSLKRQAMTQPVVALERPTWSLTMTGVLMAVPTRVLTMMSKSDSRGDAELQNWDSPVNKTGEFLLQSINNLAKALQFLNFDFQRLLVDINCIKLSSILILPHLPM